MGEHAVVYGRPALLVAINRRLCVTVEKTTTSGKEPYAPYIQQICSVIEDHIGARLPKMNISISSAIEPGYHLGSSAALAVATIGAVLYEMKKQWNPTLINKLAFEAEKFMHGNPSGGDNTIATFGGMIWFRKELPFLTSIWQLPYRIPKTLSHFYLINTGKPHETTKDMVALVASKMNDQRSNIETFCNENERQTKQIAIAVKTGNERELINAMQKGQKTLMGMGVVSKTSGSLIRAIEQSGGGAKILGGGGKTDGVGYVLAYYTDKKKLAAIASTHGYTIEDIVLGEEGVRIEKK